MKNRSIIILTVLLAIAVAFIVYQNFLAADTVTTHNHSDDEGKQLYTCGMHPDIISEEPGNCPICEMKLTPIQNKTTSASTEREILYWVAPMNLGEIYDQPGKSKMGMDLVPVYDDEVSGGGIISIDPVVQQNMNVKIERVVKKSLSGIIRTNGLLLTDETKEFLISSKIGGWIETMYVNSTGQRVSKGEKLLDIYSPELLAAEEEFISALAYQAKANQSATSTLMISSDELVSSAIKKLRLLDLSNDEIEKVRNSRMASRYLPINSPADGVVLMKKVLEGEKISPGTSLLHIADLSTLWVIADIYENELSKVKVGSQTRIMIDAYPSKVFNGYVDFIYPTIESSTRTGKARILISNRDYLLKPSMLAKVEIISDASLILPVVSNQSVIRSGEHNIVIVSLGEGKFKPVEIMLGQYADGYYQVTKGLAEGMNIVTSAQFLIDSESSLKSAISKFGSKEIPMDEDQMAGKVNDATTENTIEKESTSHDTDKMEMIKENKYVVESPLIRTGIIDVESIDTNADGKLYECPMDWNIISDEHGRCPSCQMKLKEYSLVDVKSNLSENGYKHYQNHEGAK
ncbi:MAG: efflux RND transporter periplasmic adaptor subunit [Bacteroidetes bacterium]|nr:efflux RND transporter periplasmic adaptor subunit [Bacteroidota bacterium]